MDIAAAQVLLRWAVQQGIAVIPKSNNHDRLLQNLEFTHFTLSDEEMKSISSLNHHLRVRVSPIAEVVETDEIVPLQLNDPQDIHPGLGIFA